MRCRRVRSRLGALADGELDAAERLSVQAHLTGCEACRGRLAEIQEMDALLGGSLSVPPVPTGFAARVMAEARSRRLAGAAESRFPPLVRIPLNWVAGLSAPMKIAACVTALVAFAAGWSIDGGRMIGRDASAEQRENLYGLEWFEPTPPGSIGSVYLAMTTRRDERGDSR